jgi:CRP-like cAMP-binding protein
MRKFLIDSLRLSDELTEQFLSQTTKKKYTPNTVIIQEGMRSNHVYFIQEGVVAAYALSDEGNENIILFFEEYRFFAGSIQANLNSTVSFKALTNIVLYEFSFNKLNALMKQEVKIRKLFQDSLDKAHSVIHRRISDNISMKAKDRYIEFNKLYPGLINRIPHYYIASYLGITSTQLSRIRKELL